MALIDIDPVVYIFDRDDRSGSYIVDMLNAHDVKARRFSKFEDLIDVFREEPAHCVVVDVSAGATGDYVLMETLRDIDDMVAIVLMADAPRVAQAVDAIRLYGVLDYLEKPTDPTRLMAAVEEAAALVDRRRAVAARTAMLTPREREVFDLLVQGHPNKVVADLLGVSAKTVEDHRAAVLAKTGARGLAQLIGLTK